MRERFPETTFVSISEFGIDGPYASHQADSQSSRRSPGTPTSAAIPIASRSAPGSSLRTTFGAVVGWIRGPRRDRRGQGRGAPRLRRCLDPRDADDDRRPQSLGLLGIGGVRRRYYSRILPGYPSDIFACKDGHIAFVTAGPGGRDFAGNISKLVEQPELASHPLFTDVAARLVHWREFDELVKPWFESHTSREIFLRTGELDLGFGEVATAPDLLDDPHLEARGYWRAEVDANGEPTGGVLPGPAGRSRRARCRSAWRRPPSARATPCCPRGRERMSRARRARRFGARPPAGACATSRAFAWWTSRAAGRDRSPAACSRSSARTW